MKSLHQSPATQQSSKKSLRKRLPRLFQRFPGIYRQSHDVQELIPLQERMKYPSFAADFALLEQELMPHFRELDNEALSQQNWYRWMYVALIFGGSAVTILGIVQLPLLSAEWPGIVGAIIAALLAGLTALLQQFNSHERYFNARLATERLRSEYFLFLGHIGPYKNDQDRLQQLRQRVVEIKLQGEHGAPTRNNDRQLKLKGPTTSQYDAQQFLQMYQEYRYNNQYNWYIERQKEFGGARTQAIVLSISLMVLTAIAGVAATTSILWLKVLCLFAAAICPVLSTAITAYSTLYGFEQQAKLYRDTANALLKAQAIAPDTTPSSTLDRAQLTERVVKYVQEVENIFLVEQGQWGQLAQQMKPHD